MSCKKFIWMGFVPDIELWNDADYDMV